MKRMLGYGLLILLFSLKLVGCSNISSNEFKNKVREIAWLDDTSKSDIINLETALIEKVKFKEEHLVATKTDNIDIKNIEAYKVTFTTQNDELLGPIVIYLDKDNLNVLGIDFRD